MLNNPIKVYGMDLILIFITFEKVQMGSLGGGDYFFLLFDQ